MIFQDDKYHRNCRGKLYDLPPTNSQSKLSKKLRQVDFGEVVTFIEETALTGTEEILTFKLWCSFEKTGA